MLRTRADGELRMRMRVPTRYIEGSTSSYFLSGGCEPTEGQTSCPDDATDDVPAPSLRVHLEGSLGAQATRRGRSGKSKVWTATLYL